MPIEQVSKLYRPEPDSIIAPISGTHLFVIYIDVEETISTVGKTRFKRRVRTAKCASDAEVTLECAPKYFSRWKVPTAIPLCARILLVDDGLQKVVYMFDQIAEEVDIVKLRSKVFPGMECDWLPLLEDSVAAGDQLPIHRYIHRPGSTPASNELRYRHTDRWKIFHADQFAMAASSALDIPRHPKRIGMSSFAGLPLVNQTHSDPFSCPLHRRGRRTTGGVRKAYRSQCQDDIAGGASPLVPWRRPYHEG